MSAEDEVRAEFEALRALEDRLAAVRGLAASLDPPGREDAVVTGSGPWDGAMLPRGEPSRSAEIAEQRRTASRRHYVRKATAEGGPEPRSYRKQHPPSIGGPSR